jgi:hypothetical protein
MDVAIELNGQVAHALLTEMQKLVGDLVEAALKKLDDMTVGGGLSADQAMSFCHEVAAYRRIVQRLRTRVTIADRQLQRRQDEDLGRHHA